MASFSFQIIANDLKSRARSAILTTPHGAIHTPTLMPVGTQAAVKSLSPQDLRQAGAQAVMTNTYHLMLRPGADLIAGLGGLHAFMGWSGPLMSDSGGFQVFSQGVAKEMGVGKVADIFGQQRPIENRPPAQKSNFKMCLIDEEGVTFFSHIDGSVHRLTPELSLAIQKKLAADLVVAFDDLESPYFAWQQTKESLARTNRWQLRSQQAFSQDGSQLLFGVTHGGQFEDLRRESSRFVDHHFDAVAMGGAHSSKSNLYQCIEWTIEEISSDKPRHLLGIGEVADVLEAVDRGVDMFDCVAPTRRGRNGSLFLSRLSGGSRENAFSLNITNACYKTDKQPIDPTCSCFVCQNFSRAYIRHLFMAKELLAYRLASFHNIFFVEQLLGDATRAIVAGNYPRFKKNWLG